MKSTFLFIILFTFILSFPGFSQEREQEKDTTSFMKSQDTTNIYLFSGLGADERALKFLTFPEGYHPIYVKWIAPKDDETISQYASRLGQLIDQTKPFILIGLSFGGIIVTEISETIKAEKVILISSITSRYELPGYYKTMGKLGIQKLAPKDYKPKANFIMYWLFGTKTTNDKKLLKEILDTTDPVFSNWAIDKITHWQRSNTTTNIIRIHGEKDHVLPITNFTPDYSIAKAGHFMVVNRADEVSVIIKKILSAKPH